MTLGVGASHGKSGVHKSLANLDIFYLICRVTSCDHLFKKLCKFMNGSFS